MEKVISDVVVCFELNNAIGSEDIEILTDSYKSVIATAINYLSTNTARVSIASVSPEGVSDELANCLQSLQTDSGNIFYERLIAPTGTYFGAKNAILDIASEDAIIVFCDSDCVYDPYFLDQLLKGFSDANVQVVYGKTYPRFSAENLQERVSALCWLFPPEGIGYGATWPRSRWANNFAVAARLLRENPFPEVQVEGNKRQEIPLQLKVERVIWADELEVRKVVVSDQNGKAFHRILPSYGEFASRAYVHGAAEAFFSRFARKPRSECIARIAIQPVHRWRGLWELWGKGQVTLPELLVSTFYLATSATFRLAGAIAFQSMSYEVKSGNGLPARTSDPETSNRTPLCG